MFFLVDFLKISLNTINSLGKILKYFSVSSAVSSPLKILQLPHSAVLYLINV